MTIWRRRRVSPLALLTAAVLILIPAAHAVAEASAIRVGSIADSRFGTSWSLDGTAMQDTRAKLLNPANFGPAGRVGRSISITDTAATPGSVTVALLSAFDIFFIGWLDDANPNAFTANELTAFQNWVAAGGTLIVTCDDQMHQAVCAGFGYPVSGTSAFNPMAPVGAGVGHPIFAGPFGAVSTFFMSGNKGFFPTTAGATVLAQDAGSRPIFLVKDVGAGRVILFGDVDIVASALSGGPDISFSNDRVLANLFTFATTTAPLRVGSVADSRFQTGFSLDGAQMTNTRAKMLSASNFGAGGTFPRPIAITDTGGTLGSINPALLSNYDVFFIGWFDNVHPNAFTDAELSAFQTFVINGGTLIVTCDDETHDAVCSSLGYPVLDAAVNPMVPAGAGIGHPIFSGPFGGVPAFNMTGDQGAFTTTTGAIVLAQDSGARPVMLFKAVGAGRIILLGDVDIVSRAASGGATITTNNDRLIGNLFAFAASPTALFAAVLPGSRSVKVGSLASAFGTIIASGGGTAVGCQVNPITAVPATYQSTRTDPFTNAPIGASGAPVTMLGGTVQSFLLAFTPTAAFGTTDVQLSFDCLNTLPAPIITGLSTVVLSASDSQVADIIALAATASGDGVVNLVGTTGAAAFVVASFNVGSGASITVTPTTGLVGLPVIIAMCQTNPVTGLCFGSIESSKTLTIGPGETPTFAIFVTGAGAVPFDPAQNRIFVLFYEGGILRGATSVAVRTQ